MSAAVIRAIAVAAELTGTTLSTAAIEVMEHDLSTWPDEAVCVALDHCRKHLGGRLTLSAVIARLHAMDGRLSANEAWDIALQSADETVTVVWCDEIAQAFGAVQQILEIGDKIGARMAFIAAYDRLVAEARERRVPLKWHLSVGHDAQMREEVATEALALGLIGQSQAAPHMLPAPPAALKAVAGLLTNDAQAVAQGGPDVAAKVAVLRDVLAKKAKPKSASATVSDEELRRRREVARRIAEKAQVACS